VVAGQKEEQNVSIPPRLDDNFFKNEIIDHDRLHKSVIKTMQPEYFSSRSIRPTCVRRGYADRVMELVPEIDIGYVF
jgi:hypothetical protein